MAKLQDTDPFACYKDISLNNSNFTVVYEKTNDSNRFLAFFQKCLKELNPKDYNELIHRNIETIVNRMIEKRKILLNQYYGLEKKMKADKDRDEKFEKRIHEINNQVITQKKENQKLKDTVTNLQSLLRDSKTSAEKYEEEIGTLQSDLSNSLENGDKLQKALEHSVKQNKTIINETQKLQEDNAELVNKVNNLERYNGSVSQLRDEIRKKDKELAKMAEQIIRLNQEKANFSEKFQNLYQENNILIGQIGGLNEKNVILTGQICDFSQEKSTLLGKINDLSQENDVLLGQIKEMNQEKAVLPDTESELNKTNILLTEKNEELIREKASIIIDYERRLYQKDNTTEEIRKSYEALLSEERAKAEEVQMQLDKITKRKNFFIEQAGRLCDFSFAVDATKFADEPPNKKSKLTPSVPQVHETPVLRSLLSKEAQPIQGPSSFYGQQQFFYQPAIPFNGQHHPQYNYFIPQQQPFNISAPYFFPGSKLQNQETYQYASNAPQYVNGNFQQGQQAANTSLSSRENL